MTLSQSRFHLARQENGRSHTGQILVGRFSFLCAILAYRPIGGVSDKLGLRGAIAIPLRNEEPFGVVLLGLFIDIEVPAPTRVTTYPCYVLPIAVVTGTSKSMRCFSKNAAP